MKQAWICSNCGLKRTFHRVSRTHKCLGIYNHGVGWYGIWRRKNNGNLPRVSVLPTTEHFLTTDYLIRLKNSTLVITIDRPKPFDMTIPNRLQSKHLC